MSSDMNSKRHTMASISSESTGTDCGQVHDPGLFGQFTNLRESPNDLRRPRRFNSMTRLRLSPQASAQSLPTNQNNLGHQGVKPRDQCVSNPLHGRERKLEPSLMKRDDEAKTGVVRFPLPPARAASGARGLHPPRTNYPCLSFNASTELVNIDLSTLDIKDNPLQDEGYAHPERNQAGLSHQAPSVISQPQTPTFVHPPYSYLRSTSASNFIGLAKAEQHDPDYTDRGLAPATPPSSTSPRDEVVANPLDLTAPLVLDFKSFQNYLLVHEFRTAFRDWLALDPEQNHDGLLKLDRWMDEMKAESLVKHVREYSLCLYSVYHAGGTCAPCTSVIPDTVTQDTLSGLSRLATLESGLQKSRMCLLSSLHENEFHSFIRAKLLAQEINRRKMLKPREVNEDIQRPCFCITNPRVSQNPIVMVSTELLQLTGYEANEIIGKNCQIFHGNQTSVSSIYRVATALEEGEPCLEILLTYKKDFSAIYCLWSFEPLRDSYGQVMFFVARQTDITSQMNVPLAQFLDLKVSHRTASDLRIEQPTWSPRMESHRLQKRNIISPQTKNIAKPFRGATVLASPLGRAANEHLQNISPDPAHSTFKKDWLSAGASSVRSVMRKRPSSVSKFDMAQSTQPSSTILEQEDSPSPMDICPRMANMPLHHVMIIKRRDHRIMYATENTLKFFGISTTLLEEVDEPPLLRQDLLQLMHGRNEKETGLVRNFAFKLLTHGRAGSCECEIVWNEFDTLDKKTPRKQPTSLSGDMSSLHFTPLVSGSGHCALYITYHAQYKIPDRVQQFVLITFILTLFAVVLVSFNVLQ